MRRLQKIQMLRICVSIASSAVLGITASQLIDAQREGAFLMNHTVSPAPLQPDEPGRA